MTTRNDFGDFLNNQGLLGYGAEIGIQQGYFSREILNRWKGKGLFMIDSWKQYSSESYSDPANVDPTEQIERMKQSAQNIYSFGDRAIMLRWDSILASNLFPDNFLDFAYIDANHHYIFAKRDIEHWYPKVKQGGYICGHDYMWGGEVETKRAVDEFASMYKKEITFSDEGTSWASWFIKK